MSKLDRLGWVVCRWFQVGDRRFGVRTTSQAFAGWLDHALGAYAVDGPEDPDDDPSYGLLVEDGGSPSGRVGRRFHILYEGTWDVVRTMDLRTLARAFLLEVESLTFPGRDDVIYLDAAVVAGGGRTAVVPSYMVPALARAGRRVRRATHAVLPGTLTVAIDPDTGNLIPVPRQLQVPGDALEILEPPEDGPDPRAWVEEPAPADRVMLFGSEPELAPLPRAEALVQLASRTKNLPMLGGRAVRGLARLLQTAQPCTTRLMGTEHMIRTVQALLTDGPATGTEG